MYIWTYRLLLLFVFTIPWEYFFATNGMSPARIAGIMLIIFGTATILMRGKIRRLTAVHYACLLYLLWVLISCLYSAHPDISFPYALLLCQLVAIVLLIWEFTMTRAQQLGLLQSYVFGCAVSIVSLFNNYMHGTTTITDRYYATGFDPNYLAVELAIGICIAIYLFVVHPSRILRVINIIIVPFAIMAILLTGSRGGFVTLFAALAVLVITINRRNYKWATLLVVVTIMASIYSIQFIPQASIDRLSQTQSEITSGSLTERRMIWAAGYLVFYKHMLLGVGAGTFIEEAGVGQVAHNTYLETLVEVGMIGFALLVIIFICLVLNVWSIRNYTDRYFRLILLLTFAVGAISLSWGPTKMLWLIVGILCQRDGILGGAYAGQAVAQLKKKGRSLMRNSMRRLSI
jgi:O-antigen ligase